MGAAPLRKIAMSPTPAKPATATATATATTPTPTPAATSQAKVTDRYAPPPRSSAKIAFDHVKGMGGGPARAKLIDDNVESWAARWDILKNTNEPIDSVYFSLERDP